MARDFPEVEVITLAENRPFAVATNAGTRAGSGGVIVLLNNDVDCRPDFLERLVAPLEADPAVGSVAALLIRPGEERIDSVGLTADPLSTRMTRWTTVWRRRCSRQLVVRS